MKRFLEFNTGRQYGPAGQPIQCLAESHRDGFITIHFVDVVRMITGRVIWWAGPGSHEALLGDTRYLETKLLRLYDTNEYSHPEDMDAKVAEISEHYRRTAA